MAGIDPELNRQLMATLRRCDAFASNAELRAVFVDGRLSPWAYNVPEGESTSSRVQATIAFLHDKANAQGQNALFLLFCVLQDRYDPNDAYYGELGTLIARLSGASSSPPLSTPSSTGRTIDYEAGLRTLLTRLGTGHLIYSEALVYQQRLTENLTASRIYGNTETRRAELAEIVARLNALSLNALRVSFNELSGMSTATTPQPATSQPVIGSNNQAPVGKPEALPLNATVASTDTSNPYDQNYKIKLLGLLTRHFSLDELNTLCFAVGVNFDELSGSGLSVKARELIGYCERHTCMSTLIAAGQTLRPELNWS